MKVGRKRSRGGPWELRLFNVPEELGNALEALWLERVRMAKVAGVKPEGWHEFLVNVWGEYVEEHVNG